MKMQIFVLLNTCGLMAVCAVVYSYAQVHIPTRSVRRAVVGLAFGFAGVATMLQPLEIEPGIFADARGAFVGMAMAFGGPVAAAIAVFLTVIVRLSMGGPGALIGASVIIATAGCAGVWLQVYRDYQGRDYSSWIALAIACAMPTFIALHTLVEAHMWISVFLAFITTVIVFFFGKLLNSEQHRGRRERNLEQAAFTDLLTGLPNRRAFDDYAYKLEKSGANDIMFLLLDVDHFKKINDELGHDEGDIVLRSIAQAIQKTVRDTDFAGRIGGEEFAVIVRTAGKNSAHRIAERFRQAVQVPYGPRNTGKVATVSVGGFCCNGNSFKYISCYKKADEALYHSKRSGRNRVTLSPYLHVA